MTRYIPAIKRHDGRVETRELVEQHKTRNDAVFTLGLWLGVIGAHTYQCAAVLRDIDGQRSLVYEVGEGCDEIWEALQP